jgi:type IV pilus assembly protein PilM
MFGWCGKTRCGPIGVDIGSGSVKLLQLDGDRKEVVDAARWDLASLPQDTEQHDEQLGDALRRARENRDFRGRDAVFCLGASDLFVQNIRVPPVNADQLYRTVCAEAAGRLPFKSDEAEIRFVEAGDVRQGDATRREVILMACHRPMLDRLTGIAARGGLQAVAIDVEPAALLRSYLRQFRRDDDQHRRSMFVNIGALTTKVIIAEGANALFVKYVELGGRQMDEAVARHLQMPLNEAAGLRRHSGDRRADQRDPEVTRSLQEALRPVLDRLANELSMCLRYFSVTFRGRPVDQAVVGGGEATEALVEWLGPRLNLPCEMGNPLRAFGHAPVSGRAGQWDVAVGLALREGR